MDFRPRRLPVFKRVDPREVNDDFRKENHQVYTWKGADCIEGNPVIYKGLGYRERR